ncbi:MULTISPECIES: BPSS1780 family membrane protein [Niveibacterium]|uniref:DUF2189 domain-containing protein n=1 Tax=Niveibacterium microcysteis TaxID=2811415 RepID=A0ABX7M3P1_9RHOO|nr:MULTISPECIES: BPSS1780 family membrane protein [Niveibacterium]QSI76373.1 hypothetical protein JY500_18200 [Niveibacterium microcysteis]
MSEQNPYAPPSAEVRDAAPASDSAETLIPEGRTVAAGRGFGWFVDAWQLFKQQPMMWWLVILITFGVMMVASLIPLVNIVVGVAFPLVSAGFASCATSQRTKGSFEVGQIFDGFREQTGQLLLIGVIYIGAIFAIGAIVAIVVGTSGLFGALFGGRASIAAMAGTGIGMGLLFFVVIMLLATSVIFAPYLVFEQKMSAIQAMQASIKGSFKNILAGLVGMLSYIVLAIAATIPLGLGWLVLFPVLMLTVYVAYRDIFIETGNA